MTMTSRLAACLSLLTLAFLAGCASAPDAGTSLFVLDDGPAPAAGTPIDNAPTLAVGQVAVADYLNQGGIVFQTAPYKVVIANNNRWAAPLAGQLTDTLYNVISQRLRNVNVQRGKARGDSAYELITRVEKFYGSEDGQAHIAGVWMLRNDQGALLRRENFQRDVDLDQDGYPALVDKLSQGWLEVAAGMAPPLSASLVR